MDEITEITTRIDNLADLDSAELAQLSTDIRAAYDAAKAAGPADGVDGGDFFATLVALKDGLAVVTARRGELASEEAEAAALLAGLDAEMAELAGELSEEDGAALAALDEDALAALTALDDEGRTALATLVDAAPEPEAPAAGEPPAEAPPATVTDIAPATPPAEEAPADVEAENAARLERAASALRRVGRTRQPEPAPDKPAAVPLVHAFDDGQALDTPSLTKRLQNAVGRYGNTAGREVRVASIDLSPEVDRVEDITDPKAWFDDQLATLRAHRAASAADAGRGVRQASGVLCAPPLTDYSVVVLGSEDQPTRALFPTAGGSEADNAKTLEFVQALGFTGLTDANDATFGADNPNSATGSTLGLGSATATENAAAGNSSPYPKTALRIACPDLVTCEQRAVWVELVWDNLNAAAWPELVAAGDQAGRVALAKEMEELRLEDWFDAADAANQVLAPQTIGQGYSGSHSLVQSLVTAATFDRRAKRDPSAQYVAVVPDWVAPALASETLAMLGIASGSMSLEEAKAEILRRYGITVGEYHDAFGKSADARTTSNNESTILPALTASSLTPQFPCEARVGLARDDAAFVRQGMELNLGVLRTETDLEQNDWRSFYETWTRLCFRIPPIVLDVRVNANATVAASTTPVDNCAGTGS